MLRTIKRMTIIFMFFTILTGVIYPLLITAAAQAFLPAQANGSLLEAADGSSVGSSHIGQNFVSPKYFWGRLSATPSHPYNAAASGGSNFSVLNDQLQTTAAARISSLRISDPENDALIPVDLVSSSASGLDPHISPASAYYQVPRIALERGLSEDQVRRLVQQHIELPIFGVFGDARVNVLRLNLALDWLQ